jgi:hypothetical protein
MHVDVALRIIASCDVPYRMELHPVVPRWWKSIAEVLIGGHAPTRNTAPTGGSRSGSGQVGGRRHW